MISAYETVQRDANSHFDQVDLSIEKIQNLTQDVGQKLIQDIGSKAQISHAKTQKMTMTLFEDLISALNRIIYSDLLFSGIKTN